ncbi:tRNA (guanine-N(1)-)-methyltransferase [Planctomycetales bacterium 10988]|nr:tRNA (guanine-N(1)-)-methyltransferase [Planctomycetales bacterium 10988]
MRFDVITLFPQIFSGYLTQSLLKLAIDRGLVEVHLHDLREWGLGKHRQVDDRPFGGGPGMVIMVEPVIRCVEAVQAQGKKTGQVAMMTPQGRTLRQPVVEDLVQTERLLLLCGRYEGFDDRVREILQPIEISLGDFILNGGEVAAMATIDTVIRLVPGVLGHKESSQQDSFSTESRWLEYPQYTRPRDFEGREVPPILLSGDHPAIAKWREEQSHQRTSELRPDLLDPQ